MSLVMGAILLKLWKGMVIMLYYLIVCRSLTYAQRTERVLARVGVSAHIMRAPKVVDGEGCSHVVKVSERNLSVALTVLAQAALSPKRIFVMYGDGSYKEVLL